MSIKKYSRKQINLKATLHHKEFVVYDDVAELLTKILNAAVEAGADADKIKELVNG